MSLAPLLTVDTLGQAKKIQSLMTHRKGFKTQLEVQGKIHGTKEHVQ
jgi:hypothetical protein